MSLSLALPQNPAAPPLGSLPRNSDTSRFTDNLPSHSRWQKFTQKNRENRDKHRNLKTSKYIHNTGEMCAINLHRSNVVLCVKHKFCCFWLLTLNGGRQALTNVPCPMNIMHRYPPGWDCCQQPTMIYLKKKKLKSRIFQSILFNHGSQMKPNRLLSTRTIYYVCLRELSLLWGYCFSQPPTVLTANGMFSLGQPWSR